MWRVSFYRFCAQHTRHALTRPARRGTFSRVPPFPGVPYPFSPRRSPRTARRRSGERGVRVYIFIWLYTTRSLDSSPSSNAFMTTRNTQNTRASHTRAPKLDALLIGPADPGAALKPGPLISTTHAHTAGLGESPDTGHYGSVRVPGSVPVPGSRAPPAPVLSCRRGRQAAWRAERPRPCRTSLRR